MFLSDEDIKRFMLENYNRSVLTINRLDGYEDCNFKLQTVDQNSGKNSGYETVVLKSFTSQSTEQISLQHRMMLYLYQKGISTCRPVKTVKASTICKFVVSGSPDEEAVIETCACVLTFIPEVTLRCAEHPISLMEDVGRFTGKVDKMLQQFEQDNLQDIDTLWELSRAPKVEAYLNKYCGKDFRDLGLDVITAFKKEVTPILDSFQKGYIHGDVNDCNIIVSRTSPDAEGYIISGLIDYGDACVSFYVYEIATIMADMMAACRSKSLNRDPLKVGRLILKGYRQEFELNSAETKYLRLVICARMVQYCAIGAKIVANDPDNVYARLDIDEYQDVCKFLWNLSDEQFKHDVIGGTHIGNE